MTSPGDLCEFHDICQLKYRYLRALDTQQWRIMEQCLTEDAVAWYNDGIFTHEGRSNIVTFLRGLLDFTFVSSHIAVHPEVQFTGPTTAKGIWRLQDIVHFTAPNLAYAHGAIEGGEEMTGAGYYYDEYRKEDRIWKISRIGYVRIFEVIERPAARANIDFVAYPSRGIQQRL